ncbi:hypothetical protein GQ55_3G125900 [Panicum hallii var. hallii]|uniref:Uncharacterized protein n=1 Tax=Panicum hallii var. hallii TaxID=1504633 RepID=A0A2T7E8R3_9POAL|nr:hypothetical protein GQ55_3G125900 [Panicum hallii var. hallii]
MVQRSSGSGLSLRRRGPDGGDTPRRSQRRWWPLATVSATGSSNTYVGMGRHTSRTKGRAEVYLNCGRRLVFALCGG